MESFDDWNKVDCYNWFDTQLPDHMYPAHKIIAKVWGPKILWRHHQKLQQKITTLESKNAELEKRLGEAEDCIYFYSEEGNWFGNENDYTYMEGVRYEECETISEDYLICNESRVCYGGKRAREYKSKYGGE